MKYSIIRLFLFSKYLIDLIPNYIEYIVIQKNEICVYVNKNKLLLLTNFLKKHFNCKFHQLVDICGVDYPNKNERFEIIYNLLSLNFNSRLIVKVSTDEMQAIPSLNFLYSSSI